MESQAPKPQAVPLPRVRKRSGTRSKPGAKMERRPTRLVDSQLQFVRAYFDGAALFRCRCCTSTVLGQHACWPDANEKCRLPACTYPACENSANTTGRRDSSGRIFRRAARRLRSVLRICLWWPAQPATVPEGPERPHHACVHVAFEWRNSVASGPASGSGIDGLPFQPSFSIPIVSRRHEHDRSVRGD